MNINVSDAAPVRETAPTAPSQVLNVKPPLIQASVLDAAAVSEPVPWMRCGLSRATKANDILNRKITVGTPMAVLKGRQNFYVSQVTRP